MGTQMGSIDTIETPILSDAKWSIWQLASFVPVSTNLEIAIV